MKDNGSGTAPRKREAGTSSMDDQNLELSTEEAQSLAKTLQQQLSDGCLVNSDQESISRMIAGLGDNRGKLRLTFAKSLGLVGEAALPALCSALRNHSNVIVRRAAAKTLNIIGSADALPYLYEAFIEDEDPVVQGSSAGAMATIGPPAIETILSILNNPNCTPFQIGLANLGLSFIGSKAPEALRDAARSEHAEVRVAAISALGDQIQSLQDLEAKELLVSALKDVNQEVRAEAATLLGKLQDPEEATPLLCSSLEDTCPQVRKNAALSLMKLEAEDALKALNQALELEQNNDVKAVFAVAINQIDR
ncbi:hypothetical protein KR100_03660 [Synechococcus sp. KORDI-100]|nr:hypothetical protein KR100_03660 [Synechococcus sp. KORDI-100]